MSIHSFCKPRQSVFATDRRATVLNLDTFLKGQVDGVAFFEENFFTNGMAHIGRADIPSPGWLKHRFFGIPGVVE